jgi:lipoprotein-anchoring transpeptidase ErfK/SrfK
VLGFGGLGALSWAGGCNGGGDVAPPGRAISVPASAAAAQPSASELAEKLPEPPPIDDDSDAPEAEEPEPPEEVVEVDKPWEGPWLGAMAQQTPIYPTARFSRNRMGYIRRGGKVPVIDKPVKTASCRKGFYPLVDGGFVCGKYSTLDLKDARVRLGVKAPNIDALLPYRYAFNRAHGTPLYRSVPSMEDMNRYEPYTAEKEKAKKAKKAEKEAKRKARKAAEQKTKEAARDADKPRSNGSDDTKKRSSKRSAKQRPKSDRKAPTSAKKKTDAADGQSEAKPKRKSADEAPAARSADKPADPAPKPAASAAAQADAPSAAAGDGAGGSPAKPWWQQEGKPINVKLADLDESDGTLARRMVRGFFIAVDRTFGWNNRIWYKTTGGLIAPSDRMIIPKTPELKGIALDGGNARVGFIRAGKAWRYEFSGKGKKRTRKSKGKLKRFSAWVLNGKTLEHKAVTYPEPGKRPDDVGADEKLIDVNVKRKTLVAFEGDKPVYAALISPGKRSRKRSKDHRTKLGKWRIREKHVTTTMDGDGTAGDMPYFIEDVPYVQYYDGSYALHGAFWHNNFGREQSHGCVNLSPADSKHLFFWSDPPVPRGWHGVWSSDKRKGTMVVVHE